MWLRFKIERIGENTYSICVNDEPRAKHFTHASLINFSFTQEERRDFRAWMKETRAGRLGRLLESMNLLGE